MSAELNPQLQAFEHIRRVDELLRQTDRSLRRNGQVEPPIEVLDSVRDALFSMTDHLEQVVAACPERRPAIQREYDAYIGPWILRSEYYWRSRFRPHGYAGDYRIIERIYDLEDDLGIDCTKAPILSCLDYAFAHLTCVADLWDRRRTFAATLEREYERVGADLRVLDVACGGARYLCDFVRRCPDREQIEITLIDQDAAALVYAEQALLAAGARRIRAISLPIRKLGQAVAGGTWDVVISAGLFDYLPQAEARQLLALLRSVVAPQGVLALSNFTPEDRGHFFRDLVGGWVLVYRDEEDMVGLFAQDDDVTTWRSPSEGLVYGFVRSGGVGPVYSERGPAPR